MSTYITPSSDDEFVALSRSGRGTLFRKQILHKGPLRHPVTGATIQIDDKFLAALTQNFSDKVCDIVQVPIVGSDNKHTEDPTRNLGEVVDLQTTNKGLYAVVDVRDPTKVPLMGTTLLGASAMINLNASNQEGRKVGPTLLHVAVTNRPQVTGLEDYEEILAASADGSDEEIVLLSAHSEEKELPFMELSEILDELKDRFGIDVPALQLSAAESQGQDEPDSLLVKLSALFVGNGLLELSGGQESVDEAQLLVALSAMATKAAKAEELEAKVLADEVDSLVLSGHILPAQRDVMLGLAGTSYDTFKALIPPKPIVALSAELGVAPDTDEAHKTDIDKEIARYGDLANQVRKTK